MSSHHSPPHGLPWRRGKATRSQRLKFAPLSEKYPFLKPHFLKNQIFRRPIICFTLLCIELNVTYKRKSKIQLFRFAIQVTMATQSRFDTKYAIWDSFGINTTKFSHNFPSYKIFASSQGYYILLRWFSSIIYQQKKKIQLFCFKMQRVEEMSQNRKNQYQLAPAGDRGNSCDKAPIMESGL